jgi:hypothetical protein
MPIPDYQSLMLPVLVASSKGEVRISPIMDKLANHLGWSSLEQLINNLSGSENAGETELAHVRS